MHTHFFLTHFYSFIKKIYYHLCFGLLYKHTLISSLIFLKNLEFRVINLQPLLSKFQLVSLEPYSSTFFFSFIFDFSFFFFYTCIYLFDNLVFLSAFLVSKFSDINFFNGLNYLSILNDSSTLCPICLLVKVLTFSSIIRSTTF